MGTLNPYRRVTRPLQPVWARVDELTAEVERWRDLANARGAKLDRARDLVQTVLENGAVDIGSADELDELYRVVNG